MEKSVDIRGFENYLITNTGKVYNKTTRKELKFSRKEGQNYKVYLSGSGTKKTCSVNRLVADNFIRQLKDYEIVRHKDGDHTNNSVENLEIEIDYQKYRYREYSDNLFII